MDNNVAIVAITVFAGLVLYALSRRERQAPAQPTLLNVVDVTTARLLLLQQTGGLTDADRNLLNDRLTVLENNNASLQQQIDKKASQADLNALRDELRRGLERLQQNKASTLRVEHLFQVLRNHTHGVGTDSGSAVSWWWAGIGAVIGLAVMAIVNLVVNDGTVVGYTYSSVFDEPLIIALTTVGGGIAGLLVGLALSASRSNGRTTKAKYGGETTVVESQSTTHTTA